METAYFKITIQNPGFSAIDYRSHRATYLFIQPSKKLEYGTRSN